MDEQLERIIVADEDARAHLATARATADERIAAAEARCQRQRDAVTTARREALEDELRHIQDSTDRTVAARVTARAEYAEARRRAAEPLLAEAAGAYARIVRGRSAVADAVIASGSIAFANARVRALKSRLLGREIAGRISAGLPITRDRSTDPAGGFRELLQWYTVALKSYPYGQPLLMALLRRFEIENVKLVWRAVLNRLDQAQWTPRWVALDRLATVRLESCRDLHTLPALVEALRRTPYATTADAMWRAHAQDGLAAEMGFDRWASRAIIEQTARLRADDATTAGLALAVVHERDLNVMRRLTGAGVPPDIVAGALAAAPSQPSRSSSPIVDWDRRLIAQRHRRRALCRRAFRESPFCLAPAVALLLLKEEEVRGLEAMTSAGGDAAAAAFDYALAASELGA